MRFLVAGIVAPLLVAACSRQFVQGIVDRLHHVEVSEGEDEVRITAFLGIDPNFRSGAVAAVGFTSWTTVRTMGPIGSRRIIDGSERL
jgi:hypothetical protein